jgi:hypothetical protein
MYLMEHKGFKASIKRALRLTGDYVHQLPPGTDIDVTPVDAFKEPLRHWVAGPGNYVVPVESDWGLWFDWRQNDDLNTAILPSIKGMNPITGRRTNGFSLERYSNKCPVHNIEFKEGLFCEKCNFKWPKQNYIASPNTLWWDGFRTKDGKVRQFFFTEDLLKSIPELVIGKEDTVPAFGFAFFKPKKQRIREIITQQCYTYNNLYDFLANEYKGDYFYDMNTAPQYSGDNHIYYSSHNYADDNIRLCSSGNIGLGDSNPNRNLFTCSSTANEVKTESLNIGKTRSINAEVGVGAGAEIYQDVTVDTLNLEDWEDKPSSVIRLYFVFVEQFKEIKSRGLVDLIGEKEGYLANLPVG